MSSCRRSIAFACIFLLAGCGFHPLYKQQGRESAAHEEFAQIRILSVRSVGAEDPDRYDRLAQKLHNHLLDRLNPNGAPGDPLYVLLVTITVSQEDTGVKITEEATRARLWIRTNFSLQDPKTKKTLYRGSERSVNSYNIVDSAYTTISAESDAAGRAVREVSEAIKLRLGLFFDRNRKG
jgi:hypothetical protein